MRLGFDSGPARHMCSVCPGSKASVSYSLNSFKGSYIRDCIGFRVERAI